MKIVMVGNSNGRGWGRRGRVGSGLSVYTKANRRLWLTTHTAKARGYQTLWGKQGGKTW